MKETALAFHVIEPFPSGVGVRIRKFVRDRLSNIREETFNDNLGTPFAATQTNRVHGV